jgi:oxygen-dependent protoporphyrinogen oxidase
MTKSICIIGGGISGLTTAYLLKSKGFSVTLFDRNKNVGGNIRSRRMDGFLIEEGPNSLLKSPRVVDLIKALKLETEVLPSNPSAKKRYILQNGKLSALPMSITSFASNKIFSLRAKLRLLKEPFTRSKSPENETVAEFFERRLGREIVEKAVDPFISGIFAGNPQKLSIKSAFPRLYELEKDFGSLLLGMLRSKTEPTDKNFPRSFTFRSGVQTLPDKLAENLGESVRAETEVARIEKTAEGKFQIETNSGAEIFDAVIIATPAAAAAGLTESFERDLSAKLKEIYYPPVVMVFFGVEKDTFAADLEGFGFLIPGTEKRKILGTLWNSSVFSGRAPEGFHLLTNFVGGSRSAELFEKTDEELVEIVYQELREILGLKEKPAFVHLKRWSRAIPQYNLGHEKTEKAIEDFSAKMRGIFFCSNFYKGISVGDCVKNAYRTADEIEEFLKEN